MDVREGMPSFYINREVSNNVSGNQTSGGLHTPSTGQTNMWLPKISFQLEYNSSPSYPHDINTTTGGGSGSDSIVRKKRGRPRKYAPNESHMELGLTPAPLSGSASPNPRKSRGRPPGSGWKQRLANVGEWMNSSAGLAFTPHTIHVSVGEDVAERILTFARQRSRAICILSGSGTVSAVTLSQFTPSSGIVTYEWGPQPDRWLKYFQFVVVMVMSLVVQLAVGLWQPAQYSFVYSGGNDVKVKTKIETPSTNKKCLDIQLNETSPEVVPGQQNPRVGLRNSPTEIDLTR